MEVDTSTVCEIAHPNWTSMAKEVIRACTAINQGLSHAREETHQVGTYLSPTSLLSYALLPHEIDTLLIPFSAEGINPVLWDILHLAGRDCKKYNWGGDCFLPSAQTHAA